MPSVQLNGGMREGSVHATVSRADGTIEALGVIAYNHVNPFKVAGWEKRTFGRVSEETARRCAVAATPYALACVGILAGLGYYLFNK